MTPLLTVMNYLTAASLGRRDLLWLSCKAEAHRGNKGKVARAGHRSRSVHGGGNVWHDLFTS